MYKDHFCGNACKIKYSIGKRAGRNNPSCLFKSLDDLMFSDASNLNEYSSYFLGFIASDGHVRKRQIVIKINKKDIDILEKLKHYLSIESPIKMIEGNFCELTISSKRMCQDLCLLLGIDYNSKSHKKSHSIKFPLGLSEENYRHFIRGFFDGDGWVAKSLDHHGIPSCGYTTNSIDMLLGIYHKANIIAYFNKKGMSIKYTGRSFLAFLDYIYKDSSIYLDRKFKLFSIHKTYCPKHNMKKAIYIKDKEC
jgi:hypothetical protein